MTLQCLLTYDQPEWIGYTEWSTSFCNLTYYHIFLRVSQPGTKEILISSSKQTRSMEGTISSLSVKMWRVKLRRKWCNMLMYSGIGELLHVLLLIISICTCCHHQQFVQREVKQQSQNKTLSASELIFCWYNQIIRLFCSKAQNACNRVLSSQQVKGCKRKENLVIRSRFSRNKKSFLWKIELWQSSSLPSSVGCFTSVRRLHIYQTL